MITVDFNRLNIRSGHRILDIGCGEGRHMAAACRLPGTCCVGGDAGYDNLVSTRNKLAFHQALDDVACNHFSVSCMDVTCLPFEDNSFDAVICSEVLEHIADDDKAVSELVRILKPGRMLAVSVPGFWPEKICWLLSDAYAATPGGHVRIYCKKDLKAKFGAKNMVLTGSHAAHSIHTPFWWLKCLTGPDRTDVPLVNLYHRLLVWDMMEKPRITAFLDRLLNPVLGKSLVLYFKKV